MSNSNTSGDQQMAQTELAQTPCKRPREDSPVLGANPRVCALSELPQQLTPPGFRVSSFGNIIPDDVSTTSGSGRKKVYVRDGAVLDHPEYLDPRDYFPRDKDWQPLTALSERCEESATKRVKYYECSCGRELEDGSQCPDDTSYCGEVKVVYRDEPVDETLEEETPSTPTSVLQQQASTPTDPLFVGSASPKSARQDYGDVDMNELEGMKQTIEEARSRGAQTYELYTMQRCLIETLFGRVRALEEECAEAKKAFGGIMEIVRSMRASQ